MVAGRWQQQHPLRALLLRLRSKFNRTSEKPDCHPLERCPGTHEMELEALLDRWFCHWNRSLASTPEGRLWLERRIRKAQRWLDAQGL